MAIKKSTIRKSTASMLVIWMIFNMLIAPVSALAEEATPTPEPTATVEETTTPAPQPTETAAPSPSPEVTPTPADQTITTGDASATGQTDTTVNTNETTAPGAISTNGCEVSAESPCPTDIGVYNNNEASTAAVLDAGANTGSNTSSDSPADSSTNTGSATATGRAETTANTNTVELVPTETIAPTPTPEPDPASMICTELAVANDNSVIASTEAQVSANTGVNETVNSQGTATINTGEANAFANVVNVLNTNVVASNFQILSIDVTGEDGQDIDLNELWKQILAINENGDISLVEWPSTPNVHISIVNSNQATLTNNVNVMANTGVNTASGNGSAEITTGDAAAAANVTNLVNTNIVGSKFFLGNINLLPGSKINLILPRPELFNMGGTGGTIDWSNYNLAWLSNQVAATAITGQNTGENGTITTGNATAVANSMTIANTNISLNDWFFLVLNNLGGWDGQILGWSTPDSVETAGTGSNVLQTGLGAGEGVGSRGLGADVLNINQAEITNNVNVTAVTGQNTAVNNLGGANISTGNARAVANLLNLVNTNILGSRWFMGMVNVLGNWGGKVIFAYPDVTITLSGNSDSAEPGDALTYNLHYENAGYDTARGVKVNLDLPTGMSFVSSDGKLAGGCQQLYCSWDVGSLAPKQSGDLKINVRVNDDFRFDQQQALWEKLIPTAKAAEDRRDREVDVKATIATADPETNTGNNSFTVSAIVYEKETDGETEETGDQRQPNLTVTAWNNVNQFVYPGDTVTFTLTVKNTADVMAHNVKLIQKLYDGAGKYLGSMLFDLGNLEGGKGGKVSFGLNVPKTAVGGMYTTQAYGLAEAPNGNQVESGIAGTEFEVKTKGVKSTGLEAEISEPQTGEVLGAATVLGSQCINRRADIWIWVMLFLTSSVILSNRLENRFKKTYAA